MAFLVGRHALRSLTLVSFVFAAARLAGMVHGDRTMCFAWHESAPFRIGSLALSQNCLLRTQCTSYAAFSCPFLSNFCRAKETSSKSFLPINHSREQTILSCSTAKRYSSAVSENEECGV